MRPLDPLGTALTGGTILTVLGSGIQDFMGLGCKIGDSTRVLATHVSPGEIRCVAPPISHQGPTFETALHADFSTLPSQFALGGQAAVHSGVLQLTGSDEIVSGAAGWAVVHLPAPMPPLWDWRVSFELFVGGGSGGDGFSFVYGSVSSMAHLAERGGITAFGDGSSTDFEGLCVKMLTRSKYVHISYNGATLQVLDSYDALRTQSWIRVELILDRNSLSLSYDGSSSWSTSQSALRILK